MEEKDHETIKFSSPYPMEIVTNYSSILTDMKLFGKTNYGYEI